LESLIIPTLWLDGRAYAGAFLHVLFAGAVTVHTLINKRDVPAAIGWIGMAWFAPFLGAALYIGFGVNRVRRHARRLKASVRGPLAPARGDQASADPLENLKRAVGNITGQDIATGRVEAILHCGDEAYPRMLAAIDAATVSVKLSTFIFRADEAGLAFVDALGRAHDRGVKTAVLIDGFGGGLLLSPAYRHLRRRGVGAARFLHSLLPWKMPFLDLRLHKKSLIIDGTTAFVGGLNIGAENLVARRPRSPVRDLHFQLSGTIVRQIEEEFDDDWSFATGQTLDETGPRDPSTAGAAARTVVAGPDQAIDQLVLVLLSAVNSARNAIRIATPYFLHDEQLVTALQLAALRGVDVGIVIPAINNHALVGWASQTHIRPLLESGCRVWRNPPPFDHSKLMTVDGSWSLIGSANWDIRSLRLNFEMNVELYDSELAADIAALIDAKCVQPITGQELDARPFIIKLRDAAARLSMPYI